MCKLSDRGGNREAGTHTTSPKEKMSDGVPWAARAQDSGLLQIWLPHSASLKYFPGGTIIASSRSDIWTFLIENVPSVSS
jgi:hypothetical protein